MRAQLNFRHRLEELESRYLLSANDCMPCHLLPSATTEQAMVAQAESFSSSSQTDSTAASNNLPRTPFGLPQELDLASGEQSIRGDLLRRNVYPYYLNVAESTQLRVANSASSQADFGIFDLNHQSVAQPQDGVIDTQLEPGEYILYVYDFRSEATQFDVRLSVPSDLPRIEEFPEVPYIGSNFDWNLNLVNAPEVWAQGFTGEGTVVAVLDTGVDYAHPDLDDNIWVNPGEIAGDGIDNDGNGFVDDIHGWDFAYFDNDPSDVDGHGTHVAGTIAAERNGFGTTGVAYDATILPVKVLGDNGSGSISAIAAGIRYAVDVGADVINLSLGGGVTRSLVGALQYAWANDVLVVAASGNDSASRPGAPAIYSSVLSNTLSVGSHDQRGTLSGFSNRVGSSSAIQVDAPGARIASTVPGGRYQYLSGTSMAAPHVSGIAALTLSANPDLTAPQLRSWLVAGADANVRGSDSLGGVNASRTVALAYQYDTLSEFESNQSSVSSTPTPALAHQSARGFVTSTNDQILTVWLAANQSRDAKELTEEARPLPENRSPTADMIAIAETIFREVNYGP